MRLIVLVALGFLASACATRPGFLDPDGEPQSAYGSFLAARYADASGDVGASSRYYSDALSREPGSALLSERAFFSALLAGDFERADEVAPAASLGEAAPRFVQIYMDAVRLTDTSRLPRVEPASAADGFSVLVEAILQSWDHIDRGQMDEALAIASAMPGRYGNTALTLPHRALVLEAVGQTAIAEEAYRAGLTTVQPNTFAAALYGAFLERQGRADEATALYSLYTKAGGQFPDPDLAAGVDRVGNNGRAPAFPAPHEAAALALFAPAVLLAEEAPPDYAALYTRLVQRMDPAFQRNAFSLASLLSDLDLNDAAIAVYSAVDEGPWWVRGQVNLALLAYELDRTEDAIAITQSLIDETGDTSADLFLADFLRGAGRCEEALPLYLSASQRQPEDFRPFFLGGLCTEQTQGWEVAEPYYLEALELAPNDAQLLNHVGYNWIVLDRRVEEGFAMVEQAASLEPENGSILDSLGWGYFKRGRLEDAVYWLEKAIELSPSNPTITWHLGDAYASVGRTLEARFQWQRALELDPDDAIAAILERRLELGLEAGPADLE